MDVSGIVLAGGMSRRLGRTKAIETVGGERLIERVLQRLSLVAEETLVVVANPEQAGTLLLPETARVVVDLYPGKGALGGIFSGLKHCRTGWGIVVACDMPFVNIDLIRHMLSLRECSDAVVPVLNNYSEPTHAIYSRRCLGAMERSVQDNNLKIISFFDDVRVRYLPQADVELYDPEHLSFFNVNTKEDLARALALATQESSGERVRGD